MPDPFEEFVREALSDNDGDAVKVSGIEGAIGIPGGDPTDTIGKLIGGMFGGGAGGMGGVVTKALEAFFDNEDNADIFERLLEAVAKIVDFQQETHEHIVGFIGDLVSALIDVLTGLVLEIFEALSDDELLELFPFSFRKSPLDALNGLNDLGRMLRAIDENYLERATHRFELVGNSLKELVDILTGQDEGDGADQIGSFLFSGVIRAPVEVFQDLMKSEDEDAAKQALIQLIREAINPKALIEELKNAFTITGFMKWAELPSGLPVGKVNKWLNELDTYKKDTDGNYFPAERQFRVRLIAELDAYVRQTLKDSDTMERLAQLDQRASTEVIVDLTCLFFDTVMTFALDPECYPSADADWENLEDVGGKFGRLLGEQARYGIRITIGSMPRGIWQWTVDNENLIEGAAAVLSSVFSSIIEGLIRHIAWTVEIISVYPDTFPNTQPIGAFELDRWNSLETVGNSMDIDDQLQYVAFIRHHRDDGALSNDQKDALNDLISGARKAPGLIGVLRDLGAYIDVGYHRFRIDPVFPDVETDEIVNITRADIIAGKLRIEATSTAQFESPRPVLRAYCCCDVIAMTPGATSSDPYTLELDIDATRRYRDVLVLSNRGGKDERVVQRV